jgi:hypothetical protein
MKGDWKMLRHLVLGVCTVLVAELFVLGVFLLAPETSCVGRSSPLNCSGRSSGAVLEAALK